jgi:hypothetical protein
MAGVSCAAAERSSSNDDNWRMPAQDYASRRYSDLSDINTGNVSVDFTVGSRERTDINSYPEPCAYRTPSGGVAISA